MLRLLFIILVALHFAIVAAIVAAAIVAPLKGPWYVAVPVIAWAAQQCFGSACPLTVLENRMRRQLGEPEIGGFIAHYLCGAREKR